MTIKTETKKAFPLGGKETRKILVKEDGKTRNKLIYSFFEEENEKKSYLEYWRSSWRHKGERYGTIGLKKALEDIKKEDVDKVKVTITNNDVKDFLERVGFEETNTKVEPFLGNAHELTGLQEKNIDEMFEEEI